MRPTRLFLALLVLVVGAASLVPAAAIAQDPPSKAERIERIRRLSDDDKRRLKEALERFRAMTPEQRETLRKKAREVGAERLGELAGRDFAKLQAKHVGIQTERDEIMKLLGGQERLATLSADERAYVRQMALRGFQEFCRIHLLQDASLAPQAFAALTPAEKREWMSKAMDAAVDKLLAEQPLEAQARFRALPPVEQRPARARLLREWRMRQTPAFVRQFESFRLLKLLELPPDERRKFIARHVGWLQLTNLLQGDGADRDTLKMLHQLRADERALVALVYEQSRELPPVDRRAKVVARIRELYGAGTFDENRAPRPALPRLREVPRERRNADGNGQPPR